MAPVVLGSDQVQSERFAGEQSFVETQVETSASERDGWRDIARDPSGLIDAPAGKIEIPRAGDRRRQNSPDPAVRGARDGAKRGSRTLLAAHLGSRQVPQAPALLPALREKPGGVRHFPESPSAADLAIPARGRLTIAYGEQMPDYGEPSMGISIRTPDDARVVAPYDGRIAYVGAFHSYGQVLIIDHGEKHKTLLAGLDRIDAIAGQWVLASEPVGKMGSAAREPPLLYFELRQIGQPIDPLPWFATADLDALGDRASNPSAAPDEFAEQILQLENDYDRLSKDILALGAEFDALSARIMKLSTPGM